MTMSRPAGWVCGARQRVRSALDQAAQAEPRRYRLGTLALSSAQEETDDTQSRSERTAAPLIDSASNVVLSVADNTSAPGEIYEPYSEEYRATHLEPRAPRPFTPAWPKLFPSLHPAAEPAIPLFASTGDRLPDFFESDVVPLEEAAGLSPSVVQIPCDALARRVYEGDMAVAAQMRREMEESGTPVLPRLVYVHAATQALRGGTSDTAAQEECLAWFKYTHTLAPGKIRSTHGQALGSQVFALGNAALQHAIRPTEGNMRFLSALLLLAADKGVGVLAPLLSALLPAMSATLPPHVSHTILENAIAHAGSHAPADAADLSRLWYSGRDFRALVRRWRNEHLKALFRAGRTDEAREVFQAGLERSPPVQWNKGNKERMVLLLRGEGQAERARARQAVRDGSGLDGVGGALDSLYAETKGEGAPSDVLRVAHQRASQPVKNLVAVMDYLEQRGRTSLIDRLRGRFVPQTGDSSLKPLAGTHTTTDQSAAFWWAAEISRMSAADRHEEALHVFAREFAWMGLPSDGLYTLDVQRAIERASPQLEVTPDMLDVEVTEDDEDIPVQLKSGHNKLTPSSYIIATVLPSAIASLRDLSARSIARYHNAFIQANQDVPAALRPDGVSHLAFVKAYAAKATALELDDYVAGLDKQEVELGHQVWSFVVLKLAQTQQISRLNQRLAVLERYDAQAQAQTRAWIEADGPLSQAQSRLVPRTLLGPAIDMLRRRNGARAKEVLQLMGRRMPQTQ